jgi:phosphopentomutase
MKALALVLLIILAAPAMAQDTTSTSARAEVEYRYCEDTQSFQRVTVQPERIEPTRLEADFAWYQKQREVIVALQGKQLTVEQIYKIVDLIRRRGFRAKMDDDADWNEALAETLLDLDAAIKRIEDALELVPRP